MIPVKLTNEQKVVATLNPKTDAGRSVTVDPNNPPKWSVVDGDSTVTPTADGLSADIISSDTPGVTNILVEADADLGEGVVTISDTIQVTVDGALAANLGVGIGTPTLK